MFESRRQQNYQKIKQLLIINLPLLRNPTTGLIERSLNSFQRLLNPRAKISIKYPYMVVPTRAWGHAAFQRSATIHQTFLLVVPFEFH